MSSKIDIRIIKTQRTIYKVFFELMNEIGFSKMSVQNIIDRAEINRSTFYAHFVDKFDLLNKAENNLLDGLKNISQDGYDKAISKGILTEDVLQVHINHLCKYFHDNGRDFTLLISDKGDPAFTSKISDLIKFSWTQLRFSKLSVPQNYASAALMGMITSLMVEWVKSGFRETQEEFAKICYKIVKDIPSSIFVLN